MRTCGCFLEIQPTPLFAGARLRPGLRLGRPCTSPGGPPLHPGDAPGRASGPAAPACTVLACCPAQLLLRTFLPPCLPALPLTRPRCLLGLPHSSRSQPPPPSRCLPALSLTGRSSPTVPSQVSARPRRLFGAPLSYPDVRSLFFGAVSPPALPGPSLLPGCSWPCPVPLRALPPPRPQLPGLHLRSAPIAWHWPRAPVGSRPVAVPCWRGPL